MHIGIIFYILTKTPNYMNKNKTTRGISQDRSKVAGGQDHEVTYEKDKMNVSGQKVKEVVKSEVTRARKWRRNWKDDDKVVINFGVSRWSDLVHRMLLHRVITFSFYHQVTPSGSLNTRSISITKISKHYPDLLQGEVKEFLKIHTYKKPSNPTGNPILIYVAGGRKTFYANEQVLYKIIRIIGNWLKYFSKFVCNCYYNYYAN